MTLRLRFSPRPPPVPGPAGDAAPGGGHERALKGCGFWGDAAGCAFPGTSEGSIYRAKGPPSPLFLKIRVQQAEARTRVRIEILQMSLPGSDFFHPGIFSFHPKCWHLTQASWIRSFSESLGVLLSCSSTGLRGSILVSVS